MAVKQRLFPSQDQVEVLTMHVSHERFLFNLAVEQFNFASRYRGPNRQRTMWPNNRERNRELTELRRESEWLRRGSQTVQQQALRVVDRAYRNWWANPRHFRRPSFRSARHGTQGFSLVGAGTEYRVERLNRRWAQIKIPKLATPVRFRLSVSWTQIEDTRSCRITCTTAGEWFVSFVAPQPAIDRQLTGRSVGIDRGVSNTFTTSDGEFAHMPGLSPREQERAVRLQRKLARQQKGSKRREETRRRLAVLRTRLNNRRDDFIEQSTTRLVRDYDHIVLERLHTTNMVRSARGTVEAPGRQVAAKRGLNRQIHAQRWGEFATRLEQKAATCGVYVQYVPARHTSQRCAACGHTDIKNRESQAVFACRGCGHRAHADFNAAINILNAGITEVSVQHIAPGLGVTGRGDNTAVMSAKRQSSVAA